MKILVCGRRPTAAALTAVLVDAGEDAALFDLDAGLMSDLRRGFRLSLDGQDRKYDLPTASQGLASVYDGIILAAPAGDLDNLLRLLSPHVHRSTFYLDMSGNFGYEHVGGMVGVDRVLLGVPGWAAEWAQDGGRAVLVGRGACIGEAQAPTGERTGEAAGILAGTELGPVRVSDSCIEELWAALCYILPLDSLGAILGQSCSGLMEQPGLPDIVLRAAGEVRDVARALGCKLDAPLDWSALKESENGGRQEQAVKDFFAHAQGLAASRVKSPLLADLEAGRQTDNRFLAGYVSEKARALAIGTPVLNAIFTVIREMERGARKPAGGNLRELARRIGEDDSMFLT